MNESQIKAIIFDALNEGITLNTTIYFYIFLISLGGGLIGSFLASYVNEKGKNYATKEDFNNILTQLEKTTQTTEDIKSAISKEVWLLQEKWKFKQKIYIDFIECLSSLSTSIRNGIHGLKELEPGGGLNIPTKVMDDIMDNVKILLSKNAVSKIILPKKIEAEVNKLFISVETVLKGDLGELYEIFREFDKAVGALLTKIYEEARIDLQFIDEN
jgi:hypothetical protein